MKGARSSAWADLGIFALVFGTAALLAAAALELAELLRVAWGDP